MTEYVTKREAADIIGCHLTTVNRMVSAGKLTPSQTVDGPNRVAMYLFDRVDVERIKSERVAS